MYHILWDNLPVDNIIKLFTGHKLFADDDLDVISFAPSEYLKRQFLFRYLQHLKLAIWSMVCDVLHNTKSLRHIGGQLMNGKYSKTYICVIIMVFTCTYACMYVHMHVCMYILHMFLNTIYILELFH